MLFIIAMKLGLQLFVEKEIRVPGTPYYSGICSVEADGAIPTLPNNMINYTSILNCDKSNYNQVGYNCFTKNLDQDSAFFFSRCYNQPNFYGEISNESKEKLDYNYHFKEYL